MRRALGAALAAAAATATPAMRAAATAALALAAAACPAAGAATPAAAAGDGASAAASAPALPDEVPFITTPDHVTLVMLRLAGVRRGDVVYDLGSGDGRIPITAARRFGARGVGVEIDPTLVARSRANAARAGVADRVEFRHQDLFATDLAPATVITLYLLPELNLRLRPALLKLAPGTRIVSHDWDMGDWAPDDTRTVAVPDKKLGREKASRVHLWVVPAALDGRWCARAGGRAATLDVEQRHQQVRARFAAADGAQAVAGLEGRIAGTRLVLGSGPIARSLWRLDGAGAAERLVLVRGGAGALARWRGVPFTRAADAAPCRP